VQVVAGAVKGPEQLQKFMPDQDLRRRDDAFLMVGCGRCKKLTEVPPPND
jgi:hypothetical protein